MEEEEEGDHNCNAAFCSIATELYSWAKPIVSLHCTRRRMRRRRKRRRRKRRTSSKRRRTGSELHCNLTQQLNCTHGPRKLFPVNEEEQEKEEKEEKVKDKNMQHKEDEIRTTLWSSVAMQRS